MTRALALAVTLGVVTGCHNDSSETLNTDYSRLKLAAVSNGQLVSAGDSTVLVNLLKNGVRLQLANQHGVQALSLADIDTADYSNVNLHEPGVDEADRVQYDGQHLFVAGTYEYPNVDASRRIRILATDPAQASARELAAVNFGAENTTIAGLYLHQNPNQQSRELVAIGSTLMYGPVHIMVVGGSTIANGETRVELFDVTDPSGAASVWSLTLDGLLLESRRIGNQLFLITHSFPQIPGLNLAASSEEQKLANERLIRNASLQTLLPQYRINDGNRQPLVQARDCLTPATLSPDDGYANIVTITVIDLNNRQVSDALCLNTPVHGLYASTENLYLGGSAFHAGEQTVLHKFSLGSNGVEYRASGSVDGTLGWTDPGYRMSEKDGHLRLVTSQRQSDNSLRHQLQILSDDGEGNLQSLATLPNAARPEPIGKPGEDIFAVRFAGERAYVVSFERIDPLYVLDLSNPADPFIAGQLEVPGFSSYLHPLGQTHLLAVGAIRADLNFVTRVKVELFDVRNMAAPVSVGSAVLGEFSSYSEANFDSRSLSFRQLDDATVRFTLPIQIDDMPTSYGPYYQWTESGVQLFEVNDLDGDANLRNMGRMVVDRSRVDRLYPPVSHGNRSRQHDDALFHVYGNGVWSAFWQTPDAVNGPF